jgi:hypothetical protein
MSAASRSLNRLADHFEALRDGSCGELDPNAMPLYNGYETWDIAADMARRTAASETWRGRAGEWLSWKLRSRLRSGARLVTRAVPR